MDVHERRPETLTEENHRRLIELLNELRVALPGVQVLFAFLLVVPFSAGWHDMTGFQERLYYGALLTSAIASACLIAPSALHRLVFQQGHKATIVSISNRLAIAGIAFLGLAMVAVVCLITDVIFGPAAVIAFTSGIAIVFLGLWGLIPLLVRGRNPGEQ